MTVLQILAGCLCVVMGLWPAIRQYRSLPRSGFYNRPGEKARTANRPRLSRHEPRWMIGLVAIGLLLIADVLR